MSKVEISRTLKRLNTIKKILATKGKGGSSKEVFTSLLALKDHVFYFQEIEKDKITNKKLISSNLLVNVFTAYYDTFPVFVVDFKFAKLSRDDVDSLKKNIPKKDVEYSEFILKKVGFIYDKNKFLLSIVYTKGKIIPLDFEEILCRHQDKKLNEDLIKICLINSFIDSKNPLFLLSNNVMLPNLFFYSDKKGLIYFDYIIDEIYTNFNKQTSAFCLDYFGVFENDKNDSKKGNMFMCLLVYWLNNKFIRDELVPNNVSVLVFDEPKKDFIQDNDKFITYEEILTKMRIDYITHNPNEPVFRNVMSLIENKNNVVLKTYLTESGVGEQGFFTVLLNNFKEKYFSQVIKRYAICKNCRINAQQISENKFYLHFPCYVIYCYNCINSHNCINYFLSEIKEKKNELVETKTIFDFLPSFNQKCYLKEYEESCEKIINSLKDRCDETKAVVLNIEKKANDIINIFNNKLNKEYFKIKSYLSKKGLISSIISIAYDDEEENEDAAKKTIENPLERISALIETKSTLIKKFLLSGVSDYQALKDIQLSFFSIASIIEKAIPKRFEILREEIAHRTTLMFSKYNIHHLIEDTTDTKNKRYLCAIDRVNHVIYNYDCISKTHSTFLIPETGPQFMEIDIGTKWMNLKKYIFICGGNSGKTSYLFNYETNKKERLTDMFFQHSHHCMVLVDNCMYVIGGINMVKCEKYNFYKNEWRYVNDLIRPISDASSLLVNGMDIYLFFGVYTVGEDIIQSTDILRCKLNDKIETWEKLNVRYETMNAIGLNLTGLIPFRNGIMLVGGTRKSERGDNNKINERFWYNYYDNVIKRIRDESEKKVQAVGIDEGMLYEMEKGLFMNWGDNLKIVKIHTKNK